MNEKKIRVGVLFGGKSAEHEVSLSSAKNVIEAMDKNKYDIFLIAIDKQGQWHLKNREEYLLHADDPKEIHLHGDAQTVAIIPQPDRKELMSYIGEVLSGPLKLDVIFPVLHGTYGEDGTIQGLLKLANIPFVGAGVLGSAVGMDKDVMKRLLKEAGIPVGRFITARQAHFNPNSFEEIASHLGLPFFIKPANLGSSVGISKIKDEASFHVGVTQAFLYDKKVIFEEYIQGREIECSVLGNEHPIASLPGEVIPSHEFYSYEAKYLDVNGAHFEIPVHLHPDLIQKMQKMAIATYQTLCCEGMARVDFFLKPNGGFIVNEINTIPGFTKISMYPKLWEASGLGYPQLIDRLIELAIERFERDRHLKTSC